MGLPDHADDGSLPPSLDMTEDAPHVNTMSPYVVPAGDFARRFATSRVRITLLDGLCRLRQRLREIGITQGFQWIGGSFLRVDREPRDIDLVTFHVPPASWSTPGARAAMIAAETDVFDRARVQALYHCDARMVEIGHWSSLIRWTVYWSTMFSTDKASFAADRRSPRRVGYVQLPLVPADDEPMRAALAAARSALGG